LKSTIFKEYSRLVRLPYHRWHTLREIRKFHSSRRTPEEMVDMAMRFGMGHYLTIRTRQKRSEILRLVKVVQGLGPRVILEIGTASGGTLFLWSQIASQKVVSCDLLPRDRQADVYKRFPPPGSQCEVVPLCGDSHDGNFREEVGKELAGCKVDFLFIDGDHTEEGVARDYFDYKDFVRPGGIIAFHDIVEKQVIATNQVYFLWKKLQLQGLDTDEFVDDPDQCGFGIGIVRVPR
jgi:predicted O-methyltransferase YrrM